MRLHVRANPISAQGARSGGTGAPACSASHSSRPSGKSGSTSAARSESSGAQLAGSRGVQPRGAMSTSKSVVEDSSSSSRCRSTRRSGARTSYAALRAPTVATCLGSSVRTTGRRPSTTRIAVPIAVRNNRVMLVHCATMTDPDANAACMPSVTPRRTKIVATIGPACSTPRKSKRAGRGGDGCTRASTLSHGDS